MEQVRWGIIGCGDVTEIKSGPAFNKIEGSRLMAVMRRDTAKAEDYAKRHGVPKWYEHADALINDPDVNAIYIATPPSSHAYYTILAARAGKPVYVEKPMALNYDECERMVKACEQANVPLFVAYYRRCLSPFMQVKNLIQSGAIGDIRFVNITLTLPQAKNLDKHHLPWRLLPAISGGGLFYDLGSHQLDLMDFFFGPVAYVSGRAVNQAGLYPAEDMVTAQFGFESGVLGVGNWCFTADEASRMDRTEIIGSKGKIVYSSFDFKPVELITAQGVSLLPLELPVHVQQPLIQTVVDQLLGKGQCPSTGTSGSRTARVMDEIMKQWRMMPDLL